MRLITWEWRVESKTAWLTLYLNTGRGRRSLMRLSYTEGDHHWHVQAPRDFGDEPGPMVDLKPLMVMVRNIVAELLAEEFAGVG